MDPETDFRNSDELSAFNTAYTEAGSTVSYFDMKEGWLAARDYFEQSGPETGDKAISYNDPSLRQQALSYASQNVNGENAASTVARAKAYLKFLQNGGEE